MSGALTRRAVLGVSAALALAACSGSSPKSKAPTGLSLDQAGRLANVLFDNLQIGGTTFSVAVQPGPGLGTFSMNGEVDWARHVGHARLSSSNVERAISEVWWTEQQVAERVPALTALAARQGTKVDTVVRPTDLTTRTVDQTIAVIAAMASEQRDNPQLLRQNPDSGFVRDDTLRGVPVEVLRFGKRTVLWLAKDDGRMVRFEGNNEVGTRPLVFDALVRGPQSIAVPPSDGQVSIDQVKELYDAAIAAAG